MDIIDGNDDVREIGHGGSDSRIYGDPFDFVHFPRLECLRI